MVVIRGATTIAQDSKEQIQEAVKELLEKIEEENKIRRDEITCLVFSSTKDIHSYYPAKAAREAGFESCSLFSAEEPEICGSLPLCIRVMAFSEKNITPVHVYLRGARMLRKDLSGKFTVAIDGPAGSGKSTVARILAKEYNIKYLDTGALYRACAVKVLSLGISPSDEEAVVKVAQEAKIDAKYSEDGTQITVLDGEDVSEKIRAPEISMTTSTISAFGGVRKAVTELQRKLAAEYSCVLDGRDIGTVVLPNADFKFFLTADSAVRAKRRADELEQKGYQVDLEKLKKEIEARDLQDSTRKEAPLKPAEDAVIVDTSSLTVEGVVAEIRKRIQEKI